MTFSFLRYHHITFCMTEQTMLIIKFLDTYRVIKSIFEVHEAQSQSEKKYEFGKFARSLVPTIQSILHLHTL